MPSDRDERNTHAPLRAHWEQLNQPPDAESTRAVVFLEKRALRIDAAYVRWLFDGDKPMGSSAEIGAEELQEVAWLPTGLFATTNDGRLIAADEPLAPFRTILDARGAPLELVGTYRQALFIRQNGRVGLLTTLPKPGETAAIRWLSEFEGRPILDAKIDPISGQGLVVFSPQSLAETTDYGQTYRRLDDSGVFARELVDQKDRLIVVPGGEHDVFARAFLPGGGGLKRSLFVPETEPHFARCATSRPKPTRDSNSSSEQPMTRFSMATHLGNHNLRRAIDGDRVYFFDVWTDVLGETILGGDAKWTSEKSGVLSGCYSTKTTFMDARGSTLAIACEHGIFVRQGPFGSPFRSLSSPTPNSPLKSAFGFNHAGKGLYLEPNTERVWQTLDGGRTWTQTAGLRRRLDGRRMFCTENRCEVENELVRVGWDEAPLPQAASTVPRPPGVFVPRVHCDAPTNLELPAGLAPVSLLPPRARLDSEDWIAGVIEQKEWSGGEEHRSVLGFATDNRIGFLVERSGQREFYPLHTWRGQALASGAMVFGSQGLTGILSYPGKKGDYGGVSGQLPTETWVFPRAPHQDPHSLKLSAGDFGYPSPGFSLGRQGLLVPDADAFVDRNARRLFWLGADGNVSVRTWAGGAIDESPTRPVGLLADDGTLYVARIEPRALELLAIDSTGYTRDARLALSPNREDGVGLIREGTQLFVVLPIERGASRQLARFPLGPALRLGAGEPLGVATLDPRGLIALPSCDKEPGAAGYLELATADVELELDGTVTKGLLRRVVRLVDKQPCLAGASLTVGAVADERPGLSSSIEVLWRSERTDALLWTAEKGLGRARCEFVESFR